MSGCADSGRPIKNGNEFKKKINLTRKDKKTEERILC